MKYACGRKAYGTVFTALSPSGSGPAVHRISNRGWRLSLFPNYTGRCTQEPVSPRTAHGETGPATGRDCSPNPAAASSAPPPCQDCRFHLRWLCRIADRKLRQERRGPLTILMGKPRVARNIAALNNYFNMLFILAIPYNQNIRRESKVM